MNVVTLVILVVLLVGMVVLTRRNRRRQAAAAAQTVERIAVGTDVMTTSGLHGTVVARNDDGTVQLSIAPGVEVRWEIAALRDVASLPDRYRRPSAGYAGTSPDDAGGDVDPDAAADPGGTTGPGVQFRKDE